MKILLTADPELPVPPQLYGGIERIIDFIARGLGDRGHQVALLAHRDSACPVEHLFPWPGLSSRSPLDSALNSLALLGAVQRFRPDVLHSFSRLQYLLPLLPFSLPKVMSYQRQPTGKTVAWASRLGGDRLSFTGCSEYICQQGRAAGGTWQAIHNGVELARYDFQPTVAEDAPLVFLSRLEPIKGAHWAIAAAQRSGRQLLIAGNRVQGEAGDRYWQAEIEPHLGDRIRYVGPVNDAQKNALLGQAAAMVVPIQWDEPFGIVFAEALACGTPVIACPRGAVPEIVRPGIDGFWVRTVDETVAAIERLTELDRQHCRQRVEQQFSAAVIVGQYEQLYHQLLAVPATEALSY